MNGGLIMSDCGHRLHRKHNWNLIHKEESLKPLFDSDNVHRPLSLYFKMCLFALFLCKTLKTYPAQNKTDK